MKREKTAKRIKEKKGNYRIGLTDELIADLLIAGSIDCRSKFKNLKITKSASVAFSSAAEKTEVFKKLRFSLVPQKTSDIIRSDIRHVSIVFAAHCPAVSFNKYSAQVFIRWNIIVEFFF